MSPARSDVSDLSEPPPPSGPPGRTARLPLLGPQQPRRDRSPRRVEEQTDADAQALAALSGIVEPPVATPVDAPPPRLRRRRERATLVWTMARCMLLASLIALGVSVYLAFSPVQNPGVQDCGAPLEFIIANKTSVKVTPGAPGAPADATQLLLQATCRERVDAQLIRAMVAFGAFVGLGLLGAVVGLADDRWQYHRAPRFETLLRERPADAPGRLRPPPLVEPDDVGRALPLMEGPDVWILVALSVIVIVGLAIFAGSQSVLDAIGSVGAAGLLGLGVLEVVGLAIGTAQLWLSQPEPPPDVMAPSETAEVGLAGVAAFRLLPGLGPLGFDAHALVARGAARAPVIRRQQARQFGGLAAHATLLVVVALLAGISTRPVITLPSTWWAVALPAALLVVIGALRGVGRWRRMVVKPRWSALRELGAAGEEARAGGLVGSSFGLTLVNAATFVVALHVVSGAAGLPDDATGLRLVLIWLVAWALATVSPTAGGVGVFEPAAVLGLLLAGVDVVPAVAGVLLFRAATFWLPLLVGLVPFTRLRRRWLRT